MPSVIQQRNIPEVIRSLSGMDSPDYIDLFTVTANGAAMPHRSSGLVPRSKMWRVWAANSSGAASSVCG